MDFLRNLVYRIARAIDPYRLTVLDVFGSSDSGDSDDTTDDKTP